jgi:hypothetical protein
LAAAAVARRPFRSGPQIYRRNGFQPLPQCLTYLLAVSGLAALARDSKPDTAQVSDQNSNSEFALAG